MTSYPARRSGPAVALLCLGSLYSCSPTSTTTVTPPASSLAEDVRALLQAEGIAALPAPPVLDADAVALGQALYFDKLLSGNSDVACSTCHLADHAGGDGRTLPAGVGGFGLGAQRFGGEVVPRNSPTILGTHLFASMFWDGRVRFDGAGGVQSPAGEQLTPEMLAVFEPGLELLGVQALFPPTSRDEMRGAEGQNELGDLANDDFTGIWSGLMDRLLVIPGYIDLFAAAYPGTAIQELNFAHAANAIAIFETQAFAHTDSPFERFVLGDDQALTDPQLEGALEFFGDAACARCHSGNLFTDETYHNTALAQFGPGKGHGPDGIDDFGREMETGEPLDRYRFRTPSLLNVALTAPYGHVGQYADLEGIVEHYRDPAAELQAYEIALQVDDADLIGTLVPNTAEILANVAPELADARQFQVTAVVTFLEALTAESATDLSGIVPAAVPSGLTID